MQKRFNDEVIFEGVVRFLGKVEDFFFPPKRVVVKDDDYQVLAEEHGTTFGMATDAKTFTLPVAANGLEFTFVNTGADANNTLTIDPNGTETIVGSIANAAADSVSSGGAGKYLQNTKLTANNGDFVTVTAIGSVWYITAGVGIFASEA